MGNNGALAWLLAAGMLIGNTAQATLIDRGSGLIYDTTLNITWLADANYARTTGYAPAINDGKMAWNTATSWADNLTYFDNIRGVEYSDWRLPTGTQCMGWYCGGSELGHMFYSNLNGTPGFNVYMGGSSNLRLFQNIESPRELRRLHFLREWSHYEQDEQIFP